MDRLRALVLHPRAPHAAAALSLAIVIPLAIHDTMHRGPREVSVAEVAALLGHRGVHVLDANVPELFAEAHLPGARHVHALRFALEELPADRDATLVFYCKNRH